MESLAEFKYLEDLNLKSNKFNSSILVPLGACTSLKSLDLSGNSMDLDGHITPRLFTNLSNLEVSDLSYTNMITYEGLGLSNLTKLRTLNLRLGRKDATDKTDNTNTLG